MLSCSVIRVNALDEMLFVSSIADIAKGFAKIKTIEQWELIKNGMALTWIFAAVKIISCDHEITIWAYCLW